MSPKAFTVYPLVAVHPVTGRYHRATCHEFDASYEQVTEGAAIAMGASPCKLCADR